MVPHGVGVGVAEALHDAVHHKEGDDGEAGREAFPDDAGVAMPRVEGVRQEVHQGVTHQGSHGQRDEELEGGVLVGSSQQGDDAHREEAHQGDDGDGGEGRQPGGLRYRPQSGPQEAPRLQTVMVLVVVRVRVSQCRVVMVVLLCAVLITGHSAGEQNQPDQAGQQDAG